MKYSAFFYATIGALISCSGFSQNKPRKVNDKSIVTSTSVNTNFSAVNEKKEKTVNVNIVDTYERIMDKGYITQSMVIKVADKYFFEGNMDVAVKWYTELFRTNPDLEAVYYYRYGQSLIATGQSEKGNEMIKKFKEKNL